MARHSSGGDPAYRRRFRLSSRMTFLGLSLLFVAVLAAAGAPSPLYSVMQASWGFPLWLLTLAFSAYAFAMLGALLTVGSLSDYLGRKPVLISALSLQAAAMLLLGYAPDMGWVIAGRTLQGIATGALTTTLTAFVTDKAPRGRPTVGATVASFATQGGMAVGALAAGAVAQWVPVPVPTVFTVLAATFGAGIVLTLLTQETSPRRPGALKSLIPRAAIPQQFHTDFYSLIPVIAAVWMTGGYFLSLLPGVVLERCGAPSSFAGGIMIGLLSGVGAISGMVTERMPPVATALSGSLLLLTGTAILLASLMVGSLGWCITASIITGLGFGTANSSAFRLARQMAPPRDVARIFAAVYAICYLSCGAPIVAAGVLADSIGQSATTNVYGLAVILVASAGALLHSKKSRLRTAVAAAHNHPIAAAHQQKYAPRSAKAAPRAPLVETSTTMTNVNHHKTAQLSSQEKSP